MSKVFESLSKTHFKVCAPIYGLVNKKGSQMTDKEPIDYLKNSVFIRKVYTILQEISLVGYRKL